MNKYKVLRKKSLSGTSGEDWKRVGIEYKALRKKKDAEILVQIVQMNTKY